MKKIHIPLLMVFALLIGLFLGDKSWERLLMFEPTVITPTQLPDISYFRSDGIPEFSSQHYFFKYGFTDVDEYWSFQLPLDLANNFITKYVLENNLEVSKDYSNIPKCVFGWTGNKQWDSKYWFSSFDQLDIIYYKEYLFCGYSKENNRIYLMNWND